MTGIFISYRRDDSAGWTGRLSDNLKERFGQEAVFQDIEDIGAGDDFYVAIEHSLESCSVVLVVIGHEWVHIKDETGARRLDNPKDTVRFEVAKALARQDRLVIPVLVGGAKMPTADELPEELKALAHRNAFKLSDEDWKPNLEKLTARLVKKTDLTHKSDAASPTALPEPKLDEPEVPWQRYLKYLPLMAMLLVLVAGVIYWLLPNLPLVVVTNKTDPDSQTCQKNRLYLHLGNPKNRYVPSEDSVLQQLKSKGFSVNPNDVDNKVDQFGPGVDFFYGPDQKCAESVAMILNSLLPQGAKQFKPRPQTGQRQGVLGIWF